MTSGIVRILERVPHPLAAAVTSLRPLAVFLSVRRGEHGNMVEIDHGYGFTTRYAHLGRILVKAGAPIALRQQLGVVGATGRVTALHLHYEVRIDGRARNPVNFLKAGSHVPEADHIVAEEISLGPDSLAGFDRRQGPFDLGSAVDRPR